MGKPPLSAATIEHYPELAARVGNLGQWLAEGERIVLEERHYKRGQFRDHVRQLDPTIRRLVRRLIAREVRVMVATILELRCEVAALKPGGQ